jgi:hypothetical protein
MKNLILSAAFFFGVSLLGCQDSKEETSAVADISAIKKVGTEIPLETAERWIAAYKEKTENTQGRGLLSQYALSSAQLQSAMQSVPTFVGAAFHHGIDDNGIHHFIFIPIDATLRLWSDYTSQMYIDANTGNAISRETAKAWAGRYGQQNSGGIQFHFFGSEVFDEIEQISYFDEIDIEPALNDINLTPQLLLIVTNNLLLNIGGRTQTGTTVYDASSPCPPCPVN